MRFLFEACGNCTHQSTRALWEWLRLKAEGRISVEFNLEGKRVETHPTHIPFPNYFTTTNYGFKLSHLLLTRSGAR